ncbi:hypothetical protein BRARA_C02583 [Brassica rapa]|uniref:Plant heme peroxidase family profile domain-containing protein n=1 Tax=Brassica campestris TaxID=3711 RepID=M4C8Y5_BRACM|nr:thylakoid lumenal 29 kDa protein, chloroplastic [Brassica rapa]RID70574.1 hypothetical protein BRARA_C02583 [Brassica rapa]
MGGVSFLSTLPSFTNINNRQQHLTLSSSHRSVLIRCCKIDPQVPDNTFSFHRRDVLKLAGTAVGMELIGNGFINHVDDAKAADLNQRRQRSEFQSKIKLTLSKAVKAKPELVPSLLTLALNDAMTYDKATKSGGANGSIRFSSEISRAENAGLSDGLALIEEAKKEIDSFSKGGPISYADLIQLAGQAAVKATFLASAIRKCGGNEEKGNLLYTAYGSSGQWSLFDRQFGRSDATEADPEGRIPLWGKATVQEMKDKFIAIGLGPRQLAVMSAFLGPDQAATEELLASDPQVAPWVQKYQRSRETVSQTDYEVDLITALTKLSGLGQQINYEAYTYPVERINLSKLKL